MFPSHNFAASDVRTAFREWLLEVLGPFCNLCGYTHGLEIDHIIPIAVWPRPRYTLEVDPFQLQVLCHWCHREKTRMDRGERNRRRFRMRPSERYARTLGLALDAIRERVELRTVPDVFGSEDV